MSAGLTVFLCCRERSDGLYSTITYLLSKMVEELLVILFVSLTVSLCIFYAVGFHGQWILFWLVYLVTISIGMGESLHTSVQVAVRWHIAHALRSPRVNALLMSTLTGTRVVPQRQLTAACVTEKAARH